jgi:hypothetical protein
MYDGVGPSRPVCNACLLCPVSPWARCPPVPRVNVHPIPILIGYRIATRGIEISASPAASA